MGPGTVCSQLPCTVSGSYVYCNSTYGVRPKLASQWRAVGVTGHPNAKTNWATQYGNAKYCGEAEACLTGDPCVGGNCTGAGVFSDFGPSLTQMTVAAGDPCP